MKNKKVLLIIIGCIILETAINLSIIFRHDSKIFDIGTPHATPTVTQKKDVDYVAYNGVTGKDALTLLKSQTTVLQDKSGLVTVIGERKADSTEHEYWAFLVNGKMAEVGPAQYVTKSTDKIQWRIEKY